MLKLLETAQLRRQGRAADERGDGWVGAGGGMRCGRRPACLWAPTPRIGVEDHLRITDSIAPAALDKALRRISATVDCMAAG